MKANIYMNKYKLSNPNIWRLLKLALDFGYWSKEVEDFNSTISEPEKSKINSVVLASLKDIEKQKAPF